MRKCTPAVVNEIIPTETIVLRVDATNILVIEKMLSLLNVKTEMAMNGLECINKVCSRGMKGYTMILMDVSMPVMNGIEAAKSINKFINERKIKSTSR